MVASSFLGMVVLSAVSSLLAALVPSWFWRKGVRKPTLRNFLGFSAGILLCIATIDLIPEGMVLINADNVRLSREARDQVSAAPHSQYARKSAHEHDDDHGHGGHGHSEHTVFTDQRLVMIGVAVGYFFLVMMEQFMLWFGVAHTHGDGTEHRDHGHGHSHHHNERKGSGEESLKKELHKTVRGAFDAEMYLLGGDPVPEDFIKAPADAPAEEELVSERFSLSAFVALGVHGIIDGIVIGGSFQVSAALGGRVALAIVMHKVPDGFVIASLLAATQRQSKFLWILALSMMTPAGAALGFTLLGAVSLHVLGFVLGVAAGTFLYICLSGIMPELLNDARIDHPETLFPLFSTISGYLLILFLQQIIGHAH